MARCIRCQKESFLVSAPLRLCVSCIRRHFEEVKPHIDAVHARVRGVFGLPPRPPREPLGQTCTLCANECGIGEGQRGYCGVRVHKDGRLSGGGINEGLFTSYYDPLPTNCVAAWVCPAGEECGDPEFSHSRGVEWGYKNLAVFFEACTFNCLFCQNWHYRSHSTETGTLSPEAIVDSCDEKTSCVCYFGGDPTPQLVYAIHASKLARQKRPGILRVCWETNGSMNPQLLKRIAKLSFESGGCLKFDLKAWDDKVHYALCGVSNRRTLSNFKLLAEYKNEKRRANPPLLIASTLLVPGYIDEGEVENIARFIASLDRDIPYSLLGFHPRFEMEDLPRTSRRHAERCLKAATDAGLKRVRIGNIHLLGSAY